MQDRIEKSVEIAAPVERVWRALTDYRQFGDWFRVALEGPFEPGKESRGKITHKGYEHVTWRAMVKEMREPNYFAMTWRPYAIDPNKDYSKETPTLVEFRIEQTPGGSRVTVTESGFSKIPAERRDEAFRMNEGGWEAQMKNIKAYAER